MTVIKDKDEKEKNDVIILTVTYTNLCELFIYFFP